MVAGGQRRGTAVEKALAMRAAVDRQPRGLFFRFDAFGNDIETESPAEVYQSIDEVAVVSLSSRSTIR